eukprot:UN10110
MRIFFLALLLLFDYLFSFVLSATFFLIVTCFLFDPTAR